ncbi:disulfide-isomerase A3 [Rhodnius prolixus]|uniref:disulfide-isomerase A3 n=1 Tax=Rhodnius prolixus TaxID=13249 RepID=UPI003D187F31
MIVYILLASVINFSTASDVIELNDAEFQSRLTQYETTLVMFYAPWCGHCKKLKPEFEKAASLLRSHDPPVTLAKVDCTEGGKETCNKFSVSGYPTLKIFKDGEFTKEYNGPREASGIAKHMKNQVGPSAKTLETIDQFKQFLSEPDLSIVGFFKEQSALKDTFIKVADKLREKLRFAVAFSEELLKEHKLKEDAIILFRPHHLHNKFEPSQLMYDGPPKMDSFEQWLKDNQHGLVDHRMRDTVDEFKNPLIVAYYKVDYERNAKGTNYWRNRILKVAQNFAQDFTFAISSKDDFQHELNEFGYDYVPSEKPIVFARSKDNKKFVMGEEFSVENFESFIKKLKAGEIEPYLKSEAVPESNDKPVKIAVAKNFDDIVINNKEKDVFIEFYAPWCGHCKKLSPIWDELGEKMAEEDVEIVKMDATNNDVPAPYDVRGFPTLYWVPSNDKENPQAYSGGRDLNDFIKYISKHATNELKNYDRSGNPKSKDEL